MTFMLKSLLLLFMFSSLGLCAQELKLEQGCYKISADGVNPEFVDLLIHGKFVMMLPDSGSTLIKGTVKGGLFDRKFRGEIDTVSNPSIMGTLIADNTIDAVISAPKGHAKICRISKVGEIRDETRKKISMSNLKKLSMALKKYARNTGNAFPDMEGPAGLEQLRKSGCLQDTAHLTCPGTGTEPANEEESISSIHTDYIYSPVPVNSITAEPILWDKPGNFSDGGHVLYSDGEIMWISGRDWLENIKR